MAKIINQEICIEHIEFPNIGIGYFDGKKIKVKNTLPNQIVNVNILKRRRCYEGRIVNIVKKAQEEIDTLCLDFGLCGGCTYQNIPYEYELNIKKNMVLDLLKEGCINSYEFLGIEPSPLRESYRNKMEYSFGDNEKGGKLALGMRKRNAFYEVITSKNCNIVDRDYNLVVNSTLEFFSNSDETFYHKGNKKGTLRNLIVRKGKFTEEILINLVTTSTLNSKLDLFIKNLLSLKLKGKIVGILHTINDSVSDAIKPEKVITLYGKNWFTDELLGLKFKISAFSFFQTNSAGAESLYLTVKEFIGSSQDKIIFDLYCGTGTIAQILSKNAKEVIGIEIVEEAIEAAKENASLNNIKNCRFISGNVLEEVDKLHIKPDIIILDPPRDGVHPKAINKIINFNAEKLVYISCKPTSLVRDLKIFIENGYRVEKIKIHDMFPRTYHVETVALITK